MSTESKNTQAWVRPQLVKLGSLKDVAPGKPGVGEGSSGKS